MALEKVINQIEKHLLQGKPIINQPKLSSAKIGKKKLSCYFSIASSV